MQLEGRSAIVTGGAGGLGAATVRHLVDLGVGVAVFDRDGDRAVALADELGDAAVGVGGDVTDDDDVAGAIAAAEGVGTLSIVVNVAGGATGGWRTLSRDGTPHDKQGFIDTMAMNAVGTFNVTRLAAAAISEHDADEDGQRGVVVNTASIAGLEGQTGQLAYGAAKAAILGMSLPLARDLAPVGIRVCAIAPGTMGTPIMESAPEQLKEKLVGSIVNPKRMGRPDEFALLVESIVRNDYLNGENIRLDGALRFPPK
ncbi:SDR family NAD(P)-dependent oxidoreductase [Dermatobacter hominis]|uniref:SDR family NAD(P)-dependent oxidoreductase n=1 Tax=Dermatobacter hominis TaxID=2884263 RepID=UPI001D10319E|nr:SDR family NAD(P)-dependent oxidoreductase [Dermatobacter hominis]UDY36670.1 SDR family NAD(P)-dependent oxidoreductase [Dermatobacter hominis]